MSFAPVSSGFSVRPSRKNSGALFGGDLAVDRHLAGEHGLAGVDDEVGQLDRLAAAGEAQAAAGVVDHALHVRGLGPGRVVGHVAAGDREEATPALLIFASPTGRGRELEVAEGGHEPGVERDSRVLAGERGDLRDGRRGRRRLARAPPPRACWPSRRRCRRRQRRRGRGQSWRPGPPGSSYASCSSLGEVEEEVSRGIRTTPYRRMPPRVKISSRSRGTAGGRGGPVRTSDAPAVCRLREHALGEQRRERVDVDIGRDQRVVATLRSRPR